ncbi:MAG: RNA-directed DNA polymerase, partial [Pedobacter sp.]
MTNNLFVAECDIKKFYDTVNHDLCIRLFEDLAEKSKGDCSISSLKSAKYVFKEYLNSYNFEDVVLSKGDAYWDKQFHSNKKRINGVFPWIQKDISGNEFYRTNPNQKIGVPQGGALSGLIANIVLDKADKELKSIPDLFYVRYCDDMILMHSDENLCIQSIEIYKKALKELLLFSHPFETTFHTSNKSYSSKNRIVPLFIINQIKNNRFLRKINCGFDRLIKKYFPNFGIRRKINYNVTFKHSLKKFWNCKSKGPYKWGKLDIQNCTFPWVGFVGYE